MSKNIEYNKKQTGSKTSNETRKSHTNHKTNYKPNHKTNTKSKINPQSKFTNKPNANIVSSDMMELDHACLEYIDTPIQYNQVSKSKHNQVSKSKHNPASKHKNTNNKVKQQYNHDHYDNNNDNNNDEYDDENEEDNEVEIKPAIASDKTKERLRKKINCWMDCDDKIKSLNARIKKYKDAKTQQEDFIMKIISLLEKEEKDEGVKIMVKNENNETRGYVFRKKTTTREPIKEAFIREALTEHFLGNEKKVEQLIKKIDKRRTIKEKYYLRRSKKE